MGHTYLIHDGVYFINARYSSHKMKVKNCFTDLHAKSKLEDYLKRKHPDFDRLVVFSCIRDNMGFLSDMEQILKNKSYPFDSNLW